MAQILLAEGASAATPPTGYLSIYSKVDGLLYGKMDDGTEYTIGSSGGGTVTAVSVATTNGFSATVTTPTTTPSISIETTVNGIIKGNGTAISAATSGTDYSAGTSALSTGILKSTNGTGALSIATGADLPAMSSTVGGAVPTPPNNTTTFLRGDGSFAIPPGSGGTVTHSAGALTANALVLGNAAADVTVMASLGTATTVLHGNATGAPTFGAVSLANDVTGTLGMANGGTGAALNTIAKGGIISGSGAGTVGITTAGVDGYILSADAASAGGIKWIAAAGGGDMLLAGIQTVTGAKTFNDTKLLLAGSSSGAITLAAPAVAGSGTVTFPASGTLLNSTDTAAKATVLATTRAINGVNFDGSAPITVPVNNANDATNSDYFALFTATQGGNYAALTSAGFKYHPSTGILTSTGFAGALNGTIGATTPAVANVTSLNGGQLAGFRNIVINGAFTVNQRAYVSAATLAAGAYGHDRWKAGAGGGNYSFTQLKSSTQITIAASKTLIQVIEDSNVQFTSYVLSWTGTATARYAVNSATPAGAYAASPITITGQTVGTTMSIEFGNGASSCTLSNVQLEPGSTATPFEYRNVGTELFLCERYYYRITPSAILELYGVGMCNATTGIQCLIHFPAIMRTKPTSIEQSGTATDYQVFVNAGNVVCSSVPLFGQSSVSGCRVDFTVAAGLTGGQAGYSWAASTNGYLGFVGAEL